jgi:hypothetical protein
MALPKLNDTPKYSVDIPSMNKTVKFRPFLVKEEKVLLLAMESDEEDQVLGAILDTIESCIMDDINVMQLTTYDIEYLFTKIRGKSVGETTRVKLKCEACETENEVVIPLDDIKVVGDDVDPIIELQPGMQLEMRHPAYYELKNDEHIQSGETAAATFAMIRHCLKAIKTEDNVISLKDESVQEVDEFIESMNTEQFEKVREFVETIPAMKHDVEFDCSCGHHNKIELKGMQSFF